MLKTALKVIESPPFYKKEVELWSEEQTRDAHSLHYAIPFQESFRPELPGYFISKYTKRGAIVLDPFCGGGTTALEANLLGRIAYASDANPMAAKITSAKLEPADITDVTLRLQKINFKRPIDLGVYNKIFAPFYDLDTFREIFNLRAALSESYDRAGRFVELIALSLLHGHTAGFFSVYSLPQISVLPEEQERLNIKRKQIPDYRSVVPRIIRKTASVLRDGSLSVLQLRRTQNRVVTCDARDLSFAPSQSVDLIVTAPPLPFGKSYISENWLRFWFSGVPSKGLENALFHSESLEAWCQFMNEVLLELARVTKPGGRAVFDMRELRVDNQVILLDEELLNVASSNLSRYWDVEGLLIQKQRYAKIKDCEMPRDPSKLAQRNRMLVLRRK